MIKSKTNADLLNFSTQAAQSVRKNITDFEPFGISSTDIDALEAKIEALYTHRPDIHYLNLMGNNTVELAKNRALLLKTYKTVNIQLKWWVSRKLITPVDLKTVTLNTQKHAKLVEKAHQLLKLFAEGANYAEFVEGNQALIVALQTYLSAVKTGIELQNSLKSDRVQNTESRAKLLAEITEQVRLLCYTGKNIYRGVSPGLYNEFVMYSIKSSSENEISDEEDELSEVA